MPNKSKLSAMQILPSVT